VKELPRELRRWKWVKEEYVPDAVVRKLAEYGYIYKKKAAPAGEKPAKP